MEPTSLTLLQKLTRDEIDQSAWARFVDLYSPLLDFWARKNGLDESESADLIHDVMLELMRKLPRWEYDSNRSFRGWLRRIMNVRAVDYFRRKKRLPSQAATGELQKVDTADDVQSFSDKEYRSFLARRALELMKSEFSESTWKACWLHVVDGRDGADIAAELGMTRNAVFLAKRRVLERLRHDLAELWE